jgi:N-terminal domain of anti-restriction factor ArdC
VSGRGGVAVRSDPIPMVARLTACAGCGDRSRTGRGPRSKGWWPMAYRKLTEAERRQADRDRLEQAARALLSSEGWHRWVRVRSTNGLSRYSFGNQLLIAMQCPDASYVAGFRAFLALNRCVRKGERAIRILAPMSVRNRATGDDGRGGSEDGEQPRRTVFRAVAVFDVSQTEGLPGTEPVSLESPSQPIEGDTHAHLLAPLSELAGEVGYTVARRSLDGPADGWCDSHLHEIVINDELPGNAQVRVLVHEIAHALGVGYTEYGRRRAEVLVDTVTFIVCGAVGLDTSGSSVPYVAGWGEGGELDAIRDYAETIDQIARRIESSLRSEDPKQAALAA